MNDDEKHPGLGEVIYSIDGNEDVREEKRQQQEVAEADQESFPASDPPAYSGASADPDSPSTGSGA